MFINSTTKVLLNEKLYISYMTPWTLLLHMEGDSQKSFIRRQNSSFGSRVSISYTLLDATDSDSVVQFCKDVESRSQKVLQNKGAGSVKEGARAVMLLATQANT
nr:hypothetical protein CFP56_71672 [Quercus suber]